MQPNKNGYIDSPPTYTVTAYGGAPLDAGTDLFILRLDLMADPAHLAACRAAVNRYADMIEPYIPELASDIRRRWPVLAEYPNRFEGELASAQDGQQAEPG